MHGLGILGGVALGFLFVTAARTCVIAARSGTGWRAYFPTAAVLYVALLCVTETYIGANLLPWLLFGAVVMQASGRPRAFTDSVCRS